MSGGAGHIADMNNRMRQNRSMKASNKPKFKSGNRDLNFNSKKLSFKKISEIELKKIKCKIQKDLKKDRKNQLYIFIISLLITVVIIFISFLILT